MIGFKLTDLFVDSALVEAKIAKAATRAMKIVGFETRAKAQASIVSGTGPSSPGSPPHDQVGTLKRFVLYSLDKTTNSVVVGPKFLRRRSKDAPAALEKGGTSLTVKGRPIRVAARPFMVPAFDQVSRQKLPQVFANSVK